MAETIEKIKIIETMISFIFPRRCPVCDQVVQIGSLICSGCRKKVETILEPVCKKCGKPLDAPEMEYCSDCRNKKHFFRQGKAVFVYQDAMKKSMYRFKYSNKREYADFYAEAAVKLYEKWVRVHEIEAVVPIPMYVPKKRARGYNQAEVFAKKLGCRLKLPVECGLVKRSRNTVPQKELNDRQRKDNVKGAFQLRTNIVKYKKILLIDDIYTTGSTMDAVAEVLQGAGVEHIYFICICIGEGY